MVAVICFGLLAVFQLALCETQHPTVTECSGLQDPGFEITNVTIRNAKLGRKMKLSGTVVVNRVIGESPVLEITLSTSDGTQLPCVESVFPCKLKTCNGTTELEKTLNAAWGNTCPVQPGNYKAMFAVRLPDTQEAQDFFGDGNLILSFQVTDVGDEVLGCGSFPLTIDVD